MDIKKLMAEGSLDNISDDLFKSVSSYSEEVKAFQRQKAAEYADQVVAALKKIEQDIKDRYDRVGLNLEKRVLNIKDGKDGINGRDGRDGKDGKAGAQGLPGRDGKDGKNGRDGVDGKDGVSVVNAFLDFDNSLVIELSNGKQVNAGAVLGADFAEKVKIIANGGGTSQGVIDTLASLQAQISAISSLGAVSYQGTWNASTNTPTIAGGSGTKGYYYVVNVAGTTSIDGEAAWGVGDWIVFNGSAWQKVDGGSTGNLTTLDVSTSTTLSYGNANGVAYLNGSKNLVTNSALTFDGSGNLFNSTLNGGYWLSAAGTYVMGMIQDGTSLAFRTNSNIQYSIDNNGSSVWSPGGAFGMRLNTTGLGIGTNSPGYKLDVNGTAGISGNVTLSGGTANGVAYLNGSKVVTTGSALTFDGTNLGIGTSSPAYKLDVQGTMYSGTHTLVPDTGVTPIVIGKAATGSYGFVTLNNSLSITGGLGMFGGDSGDPNALYFQAPSTFAWRAGSSEQMRLTSTGLGIGTSSPGYKLQIYNNINGTPVSWGNASRTGYLYQDASGVGVTDGANTAFTNGLYLNTASNYAALYTTGNERLRVDSSGNLGLGVTPSAWDSTVGRALEFITAGNAVAGFGIADLELFSGAYYNSGYKYSVTGFAAANYQLIAGKHLWFTAPSGTAGAAISFTQAMTLDASGNLGLGTTTLTNSTGYRTLSLSGSTGGQLAFQTGGTGKHYIYSSSTDLNFYNSVAGNLTFSTNSIERARIDSSGNLLVGTTSALVSSDARLSVSGTRGGEFKSSGGATAPTNVLWNDATTGDNIFESFRTETSDTQRGTITYNRAGGLVAYNTTSDYRAKDILGLITDSGSVIDSVPVYMGKMKGATQERPMFIAHETPPYAHTGEKDAVDSDGKPVYQQMDASALVPVMWAELQSLRKRVATLESK